MNRVLYKDDIKRILPHREPMLFIDSIQIFENEVIGSYFFTGEEWFFDGHFPNKPIVPGVIQCEIMAQTSCGLLSDLIEGKIPYLVGINNTKFVRKIYPKQTVTIRSQLKQVKRPFYYIKSAASVDEKISAVSELTFVIQ